MPSIFIWKSSNPNTSTKQIRHYSGANWFMEDNEYSSKSYKYLEQIVISDSNDSVITYNVKSMPQDWIGSELLEVSCVPYKLIKSDNYGLLEMVGNWMRFTLYQDIDFEEFSLQTEFTKIKKWINETKSEYHKYKNNEVNYKSYKNPVNNKYNNKYNNNTIKYNNTNNRVSPNYENIQMNFQEFLIKYNMSNIGYVNT